MANQYFNPTAVPVTESRASSATMRGEIAGVGAGFDKLPTPATLYSDGANYAVAGGSVNAWTVTIAATYLVAYVDGMVLRVKFAAANTLTDPTINLNSLGNVVIAAEDGTSLNAGDIPAGVIASLTYSSSSGKFQFAHAALAAAASALASATAAASSASAAAASAAGAAASATASSTSATASAASATAAAGSATSAAASAALAVAVTAGLAMRRESFAVSGSTYTMTLATLNSLAMVFVDNLFMEPSVANFTVVGQVVTVVFALTSARRITFFYL